jgi:S-adenosylmethionine decarboxylase
MIKSHVILDFYGANEDTLAQAIDLKEAIDRALNLTELAKQDDKYFQFEPYGVTATVICDFLHFNIHTWPEHRSCAIDLYSSKDHNFIIQFAGNMKETIQANEYQMKVLNRL